MGRRHGGKEWRDPDLFIAHLFWFKKNVAMVKGMVLQNFVKGGGRGTVYNPV